MAEKKKIGAPSKYDPKMCQTVIDCGKEGMSKFEMSLELDIAYDTFDRWQNERPDFSEAVKRSTRFSQGWWERQGRIATFGGTDGFNATGYVFNMKNRFREDWKDTVKNELSGPDGGAIVQKIERVIVDPREDTDGQTG
jgi:hypothetical protein